MNRYFIATLGALFSVAGHAERLNSLDALLSHNLSLWLSWDHLQYAFNTVLATFLGLIIGATHKKPKINITARTFSAIALGAALAGSIILRVNDTYNNTSVFSSLSGVLTGMGFIAGAVIIKLDRGVYGLTSAASLWATAAIGLAIGIEFYPIGILSAVLLALFLLFTRNVDD